MYRIPSKVLLLAILLFFTFLARTMPMASANESSSMRQKASTPVKHTFIKGHSQPSNSNDHVRATDGSRSKNPHEGDTWVNPKNTSEAVFISAGDFMMGDDDTSFIKDDNPRRKVRLSAYWIDKNLVTVSMYKHYCIRAGKKMPEAPAYNPSWSLENHPMVNVTWDEARAYCIWVGGDLPTEAQWEKAARGTDGRKYPWGDKFDKSKAPPIDMEDVEATVQVGIYGVSPYGCTDMACNVWQWCRDWYHKDFWKDHLSDQPNPENKNLGDKRFRSLRSGYWNTGDTENYRAAYRIGFEPSLRTGCGIRVAYP